MCDGSGLLHLPTELTEAVVLRLEPQDVGNLRLTNKELAAKASQGSFKDQFVSKRVHLSANALQLFGKVTQRGWLGCQLQHLTIVANLAASQDGTFATHALALLDALTIAFRQLKANTTPGSLALLSLSVEGSSQVRAIGGYALGWRSLRQGTSDVALLVSTAIRDSNLAVRGLDAYAASPRCALSPVGLRNLMETPGFETCNRLSLAMCARNDKECEDQAPTPGRVISDIIDRSRNLEHMDIRWFQHRMTDGYAAEPQDRAIIRWLKTGFSPSLKSLTLQGMWTTSSDLLDLLLQHPQLTNLCLVAIVLETGNFEAIFECISGRLELKSLYLDDLHEPASVQFIGAQGKRHFPHKGPPTWMECHGSETKRKIAYKVMSGRVKSSPASAAWHRKKLELYGPPS
jgi:hypothetical protein